jgi:hypothetical protein
MNDYEFIIGNIRFSYSATSTFETCKYSYKLTYIDSLPREGNFYSDYGKLIHTCFEKFFTGELDTYELTPYYNQHYNSTVISSAPYSPPDIAQCYRLAGQEFFDNFSFDRSLYKVLLVEDKIDFKLTDDIMFTARPDLVLHELATGKFILFDYKTAAPFRTSPITKKETADKKKMEGYYKQMFTYTYALRNYRAMPIDEITLWFTRPGRMVTIPWDKEKEKEAIAWLSGVIAKIKAEEIFPYNNTNQYFCNELCGVRKFCEYR